MSEIFEQYPLSAFVVGNGVNLAVFDASNRAATFAAKYLGLRPIGDPLTAVDVMLNAALDTAEKTELDGIVAAHDGTPTPAMSEACARVFTTAGQSIVNAVWDTVDWESESYDMQSMHDSSVNPSRLTIPTGAGGKYVVTSSLSFQSAAGGNRGIRIQKNGVGEVRRVLTDDSGLSEFVSTQVADVLNVADGDYLEIAAWQSSGGALALLTGADRNHFAMHKIG